VQSARFGDVSAVNAVATTDDDGTSVFFVNRSVSDAAELVIDLRELDAASLAVVESWMITDADYRVANPDRVRQQSLEVIRQGDELRVSLPAVSWAVIRLTA
jgi:alpha-N-arabinofuranosidase